MDKLTDLPNIGSELSRMLIEVGITTPDELKAAGTEHTFLRLKALDSGACLCKLCALEGAVQGIRWHHLSDSRKADLKHFFQMTRR